MARETLPEDIRRFILTSIPSVPFVEALLLYRGAAGRMLETSEVARRLYLPEADAHALVEALRQARIVEADPDDPAEPRRHRYAPVPPELAALLERLAEHYTHDLIAVTHLIHSRTGRRAVQLADAFRWRKDA